MGLKKGEEISYQQLEIGISMARQARPILKSHIENIDPDKEHTLLLAGQYERLQTFQSGGDGNEHRLTLQATPAVRVSRRFLLNDRNGVEFRWVNGSYSTRYRNKAGALLDLTIRSFKFSPYTEAEAFYSGAKRSWNQQQYTCGIQFPYKRLVMLETYYLRQNCSTCDPMHLDVGGITMHWFF